MDTTGRSVPLICWAFDEENVRIQSLSLPSGPTATKASRVPSRETEKLLCSNDQLDGGKTEDRTGRSTWCPPLPSRAAGRECTSQPKKNESTHAAANTPANQMGGNAPVAWGSRLGSGAAGSLAPTVYAASGIAEILSTGATNLHPCFGFISM